MEKDKKFSHVLSFQPCLMGVMVPDEEVIMPWARQNDVSGSFKEICARQVSPVLLTKEKLLKLCWAIYMYL